MGSNGWGTHELLFWFNALAYLQIFLQACTCAVHIVHIPEQSCAFWSVFLHISCGGEMNFSAQGYIVTDAAPNEASQGRAGLDSID